MVNKAKKKKKRNAIECERIEISSRKLEVLWGDLTQSWMQKKDRNGMDFTETEDTKKRWKEYTEDLYKKILMTWITTMM